MSVLAIEGALPARQEESPIRAPVTLRAAAGDLVLVEARDRSLARALVELCAGLPVLAAGAVALFDTALAGLPRRPAEALRGRIGLAPADGGWLPHLSVEDGMLLARRHHGDEESALRVQAERLSRHFGLDGIPPVTPHELGHLDLARVGCVRAFLGRPDLLLLESPFDIEAADTLVKPLRAALESRLAAGAAAVWITRSRQAWDDPSFPAAQRLHLDAGGLVPA